MKPSASSPGPAALVEHFFRHQSGRLVAVLSRHFGLRHLDLVEEMVQASLAEALVAWRTRGVPDNPAGWMHRVARNKVLDALRHRDTVLRLAPSYAQLRPATSAPELDHLFEESGIADSQLRMIFACCHPVLARENQIALTLKTLCGFTVAEIASALLAGEETIKKRLQRAKQQLIEAGIDLSVPPPEELVQRREAVHQCLYVLFNEGYAASHGDLAIRRDLCDEAIRLALLLCGQPELAAPPTFALAALMLFHAARFDARIDGHGRSLLLEEQDRARWDTRLVQMGEHLLDRSAEGTVVSTYHLEAGIALHHCRAESFAVTDWKAILRLYDALVVLDASPIVRLNRAIALAQVEGPRAGLATLLPLETELGDYRYFPAVVGELHRQAGEPRLARQWFEAALGLAQAAADRESIHRRLSMLEEDHLPH